MDNESKRIEKILIPELGEGIRKAIVACWHYKIGDRVKAGDDVVELVTDKASFNVAAEGEGILEDILVKEGQEAPIGAVLGLINRS